MESKGGLLAGILILATGVQAETVKTFKCLAGHGWTSGGDIVLIATINDDGRTGTIKVAGQVNNAAYQVKGVNRRWDWGLQDDATYHYAFVLRPDNSAYFLDFSYAEEGEIVKASQFFTCR